MIAIDCVYRNSQRYQLQKWGALGFFHRKHKMSSCRCRSVPPCPPRICFIKPHSQWKHRGRWNRGGHLKGPHGRSQGYGHDGGTRSGRCRSGSCQEWMDGLELPYAVPWMLAESESLSTVLVPSSKSIDYLSTGIVGGGWTKCIEIKEPSNLKGNSHFPCCIL